MAIRVVRELGCPGKIVPSSPDPGVARFELAEPLRAGMQRATLRSSYVLHARGAGMSRIPVDSQHIHSRRPLAREPRRMDLNSDWILNDERRIPVRRIPSKDIKGVLTCMDSDS